MKRLLLGLSVLLAAAACSSDSQPFGSAMPEDSAAGGTAAPSGGAGTMNPSVPMGGTPAPPSGGEAAVPDNPMPSGGSPGAQPSPFAGMSVQELLTAYEQEMMDYPELVLNVASAIDEEPPVGSDLGELGGSIDGFLALKPGDYSLSGTLTVAAAGQLVLTAGVNVELAAGAELNVEGSIYALGDAESRVSLSGASKEAPFSGIRLSGVRSEMHHTSFKYGNILLDVQGTGQAPIVVDHCSFDSWVGIPEPLAVNFSEADGLRVQNSKLGVDTLPGEMEGETMKGKESAAVIAANTFGPRVGYEDILDLGPCGVEHQPMVIGNEFIGGEDDAIDFDSCTGIIARNHIHGFGGQEDGPGDGGGLTGDGNSVVVVANNIIEDCIHAVGYKDQVQALLLNNTITGCDEGIRLLGAVKLHAVGNIFWNNEKDLVVQAPASANNLTAEDNIIVADGLGGTNLSSDPLFTKQAESDFGLSEGSPALDLDYATVDGFQMFQVFGEESLREVWALDFLGQERALPIADLGAIERQ